MAMYDVLQCKYKIFMKEIGVSYLIHLSPLVPSLRLSDVQGATTVALEFSHLSNQSVTNPMFGLVLHTPF